MREPRDPLGALNSGQRAAAEYGTAGLPHELPGPLLIIAGAGTGKTTTLAHRVAHLMLRGANPKRILLLTFTRRAAETMGRRAAQIAAQVRGTGAGVSRVEWSGTFHAIANRLLRMHAETVGLDPAFTVLDRSDAADLLNVARHELGLSRQATRFPKKDTCLAIYSHTVNAGRRVEETLERAFPWCASWAEELKRLFGAYVAAKQRRHLLDYDDLLLYWFHLMSEATPAEAADRALATGGRAIKVIGL
jgi:DNA helicase-2/ATP-dependent DNA helicase PcrA